MSNETNADFTISRENELRVGGECFVIAYRIFKNTTLN